jgi:hypothetical protein
MVVRLGRNLRAIAKLIPNQTVLAANPMKRKLCRMSTGRNASARDRNRSSGQRYRAVNPISLFVGCRSGHTVVFDTETGKELHALPKTAVCHENALWL